MLLKKKSYFFCQFDILKIETLAEKYGNNNRRIGDKVGEKLYNFLFGIEVGIEFGIEPKKKSEPKSMFQE